MKSFEEDFNKDKELRNLMKSIKLDKPTPDFTKLVMNRVFQESCIIEQVKAEPILGKGFWIILVMFCVLMAAMVGFSDSVVSEQKSFIPDINSFEFMSGYRAFFENLGNLPASIAGISLAFASLIFLERYLSSKKSELA